MNRMMMHRLMMPTMVVMPTWMMHRLMALRHRKSGHGKEYEPCQ
jgi:hypothetical protein